MSPPEVWGPAVWKLFHTLAQKVNEEAYLVMGRSIFDMIVRICKFLPCPDCARDASNFLGKVKVNTLKTKEDLKNVLFVFHNWVNAKKHKPAFAYSKLAVYDDAILGQVVQNFYANYHTKGNMQMLSETFQRTFVLKDFNSWFRYYSKAFAPANALVEKVPDAKDDVVEKVLEEEKTSSV